jgi:indole-3-glycerol phosphate synthase
MKNGQIFIAEIKTQSPYGYKSERDFNVLAYEAITFGDWISVHDNALWGGDFETIAFVRKQTRKPILAKGLHSTDDDIQRALDHGANYVLVVDRLPRQEFWKKCLFEWSSVVNWRLMAENIYEGTKHKYVHNIRDLTTGIGHKYNALPEYVEYKKKHPESWICQASGIRTLNDVDPNVNAFIVGTHMSDICVSIHEEQRRMKQAELQTIYEK